MSSEARNPVIRCCVGDVGTFAVDAVLFPLDGAHVSDEAAAVLWATDGLLTLFVGGTNVFRLEGTPISESHGRDHVSLSLSMFLEWVWYDKAYRCDQGTKSFSEIIAGDASPEVTFGLVGDVVTIRWELSGWSRGGVRYAAPSGCGRVSYREYVSCLATAVDTIVAACDWRCRSGGCAGQWDRWLDGYSAEREEFRRHAERLLA